jgi:hypothetical protein
MLTAPTLCAGVCSLRLAPDNRKGQTVRRICCPACPNSSGGPWRHANYQFSNTSSSCRLSDKRFLVIIVSPDGDVQNRVIFTKPITPSRTS